MESSAPRLASPASQPALRLFREPAETLPDPLSSFVGREPELREIARLLDTTRLLSLTGAGGSGKTRLAIESARRAHGRFADGVWWVELASVEHPPLVPNAVLSAIGERAQTGRSVAAQLAATLADRELLLVFDNCEHVVAECAGLVATLLRASPRLRVLATSREALNVPGEVVWPVPTLREDTAVRLFDERARAASPSFQITDDNAAAVAEICRRLDGLPLAIELAAARVTVLSPGEIASRLDDCFRLLGRARHGAIARQVTLRATIDWSYDLLTRDERELLARLSTFAGGCTLAAAESVCAGDDIAPSDVLVHLAALVDRSLVIAEATGPGTRYRLLETVRQYAAERLDATDAAEVVRRRHAAYFAAAAQAANAERFGPARDAVVEPLRADLDNIRGALHWSSDHDADLFVTLAFGLGWCYFAWGLWWEGRDWLERALALPAGSRRDAGRAQALADLAYLASHQRDIALAVPLLEDAMALWAELGRERERGHAGQSLAQAYLFEGSPASLETALALGEEAERRLRAVNDLLGTAWASATLGGIHAARRDPAQSLAAYDIARQLAYQAGHLMTVGIGCMGMASVSLLSGDLPRAAVLLREGLAAHRRAPDFMFLAWTIEVTAMYAATSGNMAGAARLLGADQMLRRHAGAVISVETTYPELYAAIVRGARDALGDAGYDGLLDEGRRLDAHDAITLAEQIVALDAPGRSDSVEATLADVELRVGT